MHWAFGKKLHCQRRQLWCRNKELRAYGDQKTWTLWFKNCNLSHDPLWTSLYSAKRVGNAQVMGFVERIRRSYKVKTWACSPCPFCIFRKAVAPIHGEYSLSQALGEELCMHWLALALHNNPVTWAFLAAFGGWESSGKTTGLPWITQLLRDRSKTRKSDFKIHTLDNFTQLRWVRDVC